MKKTTSEVTSEASLNTDEVEALEDISDFNFDDDISSFIPSEEDWSDFDFPSDDIDEPLDTDLENEKDSTDTTIVKNNKHGSNPADLSKEQIENIVHYHEGMDSHKFKEYGFKLIVGAVIGYGVLAIVDIVLSNVIENYTTSSVFSSFIDLLKYIIPTLIGFVFADTKGRKSKEEKEKK